MAITNGYCTLAQFKPYANISSTNATDDGAIELIIEDASRFIDNETGRTFYARTETKYYSVPEEASRELRVDDDLLTITTLTNGDGDTIASDYYNLIPKNSDPKYAILLKESGDYWWTFDSDGNAEYVITIAGTWGFAAAAPHNVRSACMQIALSMYQGRFDENGRPAMTDVTQRTIAYYRRRL